MKFFKLSRTLISFTASVVLASVAPIAVAQTAAAGPDIYKIVVPLPAGGGVDVFVRKLSETNSKQLNKTVIV